MVGYNVLEMYLRTTGIFLLVFKRYVKKSHLAVHISGQGRGGGGVTKSAHLVHIS